MAAKKPTKKAPKKGAARVAEEKSEAKFPYTTKPASLRRLLKLIPEKPKPPKLTGTVLKSWGFLDNNDATMLRVLKAVNLLDSSGTPTEVYTNYMNIAGGGAALAPQIREAYKPLFDSSHTPYLEDAVTLKNMFNINSGGSTIDHQINTFKALCEFADFDSVEARGAANVRDEVVNPASVIAPTATGLSAAVNINLHIHLPENKSRRDYENMIEDIGRYIFGRTGGGDGGSQSSS